MTKAPKPKISKRGRGRPVTTGTGRPINIRTQLDFRAAVRRYLEKLNDDIGVVSLTPAQAIVGLATQRLKELKLWVDDSSEDEDLA